MNNTNNTNTIDYTHVRKLKQYPTEWISDAIETYSEWELSGKPWIEFRGLHFDRSDFAALDEKQGLIKFLDIVQAGRQETKKGACPECWKPSTLGRFCNDECQSNYWHNRNWARYTDAMRQEKSEQGKKRMALDFMTCMSRTPIKRWIYLETT